MAKKVDPIQAVNKLKHRIDLNEKRAVVPVDKEHAGRVTPAQYNKFRGAAGYREYIEHVDIFDIDPGRYTGIYLGNTILGADDSGVSLVDKTQGDANHVQYLVTTSNNGRIYYKNTHINGSNPSTSPIGWGEILKHYVLWEGNVDAIGTTLTLDDSLDKYRYLEITIQFGEHIEVATVLASADNYTVARNNPHNDELFNEIFETTLLKDKKNHKKLTIDSNFAYLDTGASISKIDDKAQIWKIRGLV